MQNKRSRISYKNRKLRANQKEEWNIVENTHEPIIEKKIFEAVQKMVIVQKYNRNEKIRRKYELQEEIIYTSQSIIQELKDIIKKIVLIYEIEKV